MTNLVTGGVDIVATSVSSFIVNTNNLLLVNRACNGAKISWIFIQRINYLSREVEIP